MQAFIKDENELIINSQILDNEKEALVKFTEKAVNGGVTPVELYDTEGNVAGIKFKINNTINNIRKELPDNVVTCEHCKKLEYEDEMTWYGGKQYCRECTYKRWDSIEGYDKNYVHTVFPERSKK